MKHYLSIYYGIDENLPDEEFYQKIKEINQECEEKVETLCRKLEENMSIRRKYVKTH